MVLTGPLAATPELPAVDPTTGAAVTMRPLGDDDVDAMVALVALTEPGPFRPRTIELGGYVGIFHGTQLVAMAGQRLRPPGFREVSAVCTHPDARRRGYASIVTAEVSRGVLARGETPFLHVAVTEHAGDPRVRAARLHPPRHRPLRCLPRTVLTRRAVVGRPPWRCDASAPSTSASSGSAATTSACASTRPSSTAVIHAALDAGINFLDTADVYGGKGASEEIIGKALAGGRRDEVVIAHQVRRPRSTATRPARGRPPTGSRQAVEGSLRRLQTDRIDLYQQHVFDPDVPIEETQGALAELVAAGKVREIGSTNFDAAQIDAAEALSDDKAWPRFVSVQNRFSLLDREAAGRRDPRVRAAGHRLPAVLPARRRGC